MQATQATTEAATTGSTGLTTQVGSTTSVVDVTTTDASSGSSSSSTGDTPSGNQGDPCNPWQQTSCRDGLKCAPVASDGGDYWDSNVCVPAGTDAPGMPCQAEDGATVGDSCQAGALCWDVDPETLLGECHALCGGTPQSPSCGLSAMHCFVSYDGVLNVCVDRCDPFVPDACDGVCVYDEISAFICLPDASDGADIGDPCEALNDCPPSSLCVAAPDLCEGRQACCARVCNDEEPCSGALVCHLDFTDDQGLEVGYCGPAEP